MNEKTVKLTGDFNISGSITLDMEVTAPTKTGVSITAMDDKSFDEWLTRGGDVALANAVFNAYKLNKGDE